jgi:hypothetical protein
MRELRKLKQRVLDGISEHEKDFKKRGFVAVSKALPARLTRSGR